MPDQHSGSCESSDNESDEDAATAILEKLSLALGKRKRKKSFQSAHKLQKLDGGEQPQPFDPSLDREDKDEYKFDVPEVISKYLEQHFQKELAKEERTAMLKRHPKPNSKVMVPPKLDQFCVRFCTKEGRQGERCCTK